MSEIVVVVSDVEFVDRLKAKNELCVTLDDEGKGLRFFNGLIWISYKLNIISKSSKVKTKYIFLLDSLLNWKLKIKQYDYIFIENIHKLNLDKSTENWKLVSSIINVCVELKLWYM